MRETAAARGREEIHLPVVPSGRSSQPPWGAGAAVAAIGVYQRYVSPRKGYCCAWGAHTGKTTCSAWGRRVMGRYGLVRGWALLMRQFRRCHGAAQALSAAQSLAMAETPPAAPGAADLLHGNDGQGEKPNDPVVNEPCPLWSKGAAVWWLRNRKLESALCCFVIGSS